MTSVESQGFLHLRGEVNQGLKCQCWAPLCLTIPVCIRISSFLRLRGLSIRSSPSSSASLSNPGKSIVARAVAPNGQPRKIPAALLAAGESGLKAYAADEDQPDSAKSDQWKINSCSVPECGLTPFAPLADGLHSGSHSIDLQDK